MLMQLSSGHVFSALTCMEWNGYVQQQGCNPCTTCRRDIVSQAWGNPLEGALEGKCLQGPGVWSSGTATGVVVCTSSAPCWALRGWNERP